MQVTMALRPEKISISRERSDVPNAVAGVVKDVAYFGKDSLYRVTLPSGALVAVHAVNARRTGEAGRVASRLQCPACLDRCRARSQRWWR